MVQTGKRYVAPSGAEVVVTKAGPGALTDADAPLVLKDAGQNPTGAAGAGGADLQLGKRYRAADGGVELLVTKAGRCDLRYDGKPMEMLQPRQLPSSD